jgi:hypothetical protein
MKENIRQPRSTVCRETKSGLLEYKGVLLNSKLNQDAHSTNLAAHFVKREEGVGSIDA